jgi:hypothetical protein
MSDAWIIKYEDADVSDDVFVGEDAEEDAKRTYELRSMNWNCHLFGPAERIATLTAELAQQHALLLETGKRNKEVAEALRVALEERDRMRTALIAVPPCAEAERECRQYSIPSEPVGDEGTYLVEYEPQCAVCGAVMKRIPRPNNTATWSGWLCNSCGKYVPDAPPEAQP